MLLNSVYQLLNYIINEGLKNNVEPANLLEPGQGEGRQGRCVNGNMQKLHFITNEANRQNKNVYKKVYRVDIDLRNAFNAMSQDALWSVMRLFHVDLLEQIYDDVSVRLAPNDEESATITFNTGVAQGSIISPQLFNIFINALLRMLTVTGQREDISHGLQIDEDQDSRDADHGYQFNDIGLIDDISIFADTPEGMQKLLHVVQKIKEWCGSPFPVPQYPRYLIKVHCLETFAINLELRRRRLFPSFLILIND